MREVVSVWEEIGNQLRQAREQAGLSLEEIRDQTKIDIVSLRALERGDFDKISSPFYVRSHIRAYAKIVGLEPTYLLKKYRPIQDSDNTEQGNGLDSTGVINQMTGSWTPVGGDSPDLQHTVIHRRKTEPMDTPGAVLPAPSPSSDPRERTTYDPYRTRHSEPLSKVPDSGMTGGAVEPQSGGTSPGSHSGRNQNGRITETTRLPALRHSGLHRGGLTGTYTGHPAGATGGSHDNRIPSHHEDSSPYGEWRTRSEPMISSPTDQSRQSMRRSGRHTSVNSIGEVTESVHPEESESVLYPEPAGSLPSRSAGALVPYQPPAEDGEGRLSRTAARKAIDISPRGKGAGRWAAMLPKTWGARIGVFAAIILIPLAAVLAYNSINKPNEEQAQQKQRPSGGGRTNVASTDNSSSSAQVVPVNQGAGFTEYKLSEPDAVELRFKAQNSSWIQIRDQKEANSYLKDFTLNSGEEYPFKLEQGAKTDLWITVGAPQHIEITLNGQPIQAAKSVHIIISDSD